MIVELSYDEHLGLASALRRAKEDMEYEARAGRRRAHTRGEHMQFVLSLSYGKDSMACLGAIKHLGWPLDRIVTADLWATPTIPADHPLMVEFKARADEKIWREYGIRVEHYTTRYAEGITGERVSYEGVLLPEDDLWKIRGED